MNLEDEKKNTSTRNGARVVELDANSRTNRGVYRVALQLTISPYYKNKRAHPF